MRSSLFFAVLFLCSCGPSFQAGDGPGVTLEVEPRSVSAGASVTLLLRNGTGSDIGYNLCSSALERLDEGSWRPIPSNRVCTMEIRTLPPGEETRYPLEVPGGLEPGEYRYLTNVEMMDAGDRGPVRSDPFRVTQ